MFDYYHRLEQQDEEAKKVESGILMKPEWQPILDDNFRPLCLERKVVVDEKKLPYLETPILVAIYRIDTKPTGINGYDRMSSRLAYAIIGEVYHYRFKEEEGIPVSLIRRRFPEDFSAEDRAELEQTVLDYIDDRQHTLLANDNTHRYMHEPDESEEFCTMIDDNAVMHSRA